MSDFVSGYRTVAEAALAWFDNEPSSPEVDQRGTELARTLLSCESDLRAAEQRAEEAKRQAHLLRRELDEDAHQVERAEQRAEQAVKAQLESEDELAGELAEERTLHQQTILRAEQAERALQRINEILTAWAVVDHHGPPLLAQQVARTALALPGEEEEVPWPEQYKGE